MSEQELKEAAATMRTDLLDAAELLHRTVDMLDKSAKRVPLAELMKVDPRGDLGMKINRCMIARLRTQSVVDTALGYVAAGILPQ